MADHSITIQNSVNCFGPAPSTKWGSGSPYTMTWGTSKWGEGTEDLIVSVDKFISNSLSPDTSNSFDVTHLLSETLTLSFETSSEGLRDGSGYLYVFISGTTEGESRASNTYTEGSVAAQSYTSLSVSVTEWS